MEKPVPFFARSREPGRSTLVSHNVVVSGRRTSLRLEPEMWEGLHDICEREHVTLHQICTAVCLQKLKETSLTGAIRVFVIRYYRQASTEEGHLKAGHGCGLSFIQSRPQPNDNGPPDQALKVPANLNKTNFY